MKVVCVYFLAVTSQEILMSSQHIHGDTGKTRFRHGEGVRGGQLLKELSQMKVSNLYSNSKGTLEKKSILLRMAS